jgi:hydroxymethylbilane synthase
VAGLKRLGWEGRICEILPPWLMCPAVGQGALALESRETGPGRDACARFDHTETRAAVTAERAVLAALGGGCQVPIGAYATVQGDRLRLRGMVAAPDGSELVCTDTEGAVADAHSLGRNLAQELLGRGARTILDAVYAR